MHTCADQEGVCGEEGETEDVGDEFEVQHRPRQLHLKPMEMGEPL